MRTGGSNPPLSVYEIGFVPMLIGSVPMSGQGTGEMTEWPKVHDWKSCVSRGTEGSNPSLSDGSG